MPAAGTTMTTFAEYTDIIYKIAFFPSVCKISVDYPAKRMANWRYSFLLAALRCDCLIRAVSLKKPLRYFKKFSHATSSNERQWLKMCFKRHFFEKTQ